MKKVVQMSGYTISYAEDPTYVPPFDEKDLPTEAELEKARQSIRQFNQERHLMACAAADLIEQNPELALKNAREHIRRFSAKWENFQPFYRRWEEILKNWTPQKICAYLRDERYADSGLRLSAPCFGELPDAALAKIVDTVYGQTT